jgi:chemotaxis protein methyltransferase CheR
MSILDNKPLTDEDFLYFKEKIQSVAGINLNISKKTLIQSRLNSLLDRLEIKSFKDYRQYLEKLPDSDPAHQAFINLLTTNKTEWFREIEHFNYLIQKFIPKWKTLGKKTLNIWSAASSTGEEAYSLAMALEKIFDGSEIDFRILGSDIDTNVIAHAKNGVYKKEQLANIPKEYHCYFISGTEEITDWMKVSEKIKAKVSFQLFNLNNLDFRTIDHTFDLIFCRNVMIYFSPQMITEVANNIYEVADSDSVLIISHSESMQNLKTNWKVRQPSIYIKGQHYR